MEKQQKMSKMEEFRARRRKNKKAKIIEQKSTKKDEIRLHHLLRPVLFLVLSLILEIASFALFKFETGPSSTQFLPTYILFDISAWLIIGGLILIFPKNWISNIIFYVALIFEFLLFILNYALRNTFGNLFSFEKITLFSELTANFKTIFLNTNFLLVFAVSLIFIIIAILIFNKCLKNKKAPIKKISKPIFCLIIFLLASTVGTGSYLAQTALLKTSATDTEISNDEYLINNLQIQDLSYMKFGTWGYYFNNIIDNIFGKYNLTNDEKTTLLDDFNSKLTSKNTSADLYGDNLIIINLESFEWFAIDPFNTPNLWALKTGTASDNISSQAMVFTNYLANNKTDTNENISLLGFSPTSSSLNLTSSRSFTAKYSLANLFKNEDYETSYFYNWETNSFNRKNNMTNLGFKNIYSIDDYISSEKSAKTNYYNLESDFLSGLMTKIAPTGKKFMSYYSTVLTKGSYAVTNEKLNSYYAKYDENLSQLKTWFDEQEYEFPSSATACASLRTYKAEAMDTDEMIGKLFKHLKDNSLLNNTTVILTSNQNASSENLSNLIKSTSITDYSNKKTYTVPMMIYSSKLSASTIDTFSSVYDIYPTIASLFGLAYNTICAQGKNALSAEISETIYMSNLTGFYNDKCYSKSMQLIKKYDTAIDQDETNFKINVCKFLQKQKTLETIYLNNYTF